MVPNKDQRSQDYSEMEVMYRPSHADATYDFKYGIRAVAGGGRSSARETIGRVAAGAVAKKLLAAVSGTEVLAYVNRVRDVVANVDHDTFTMDDIEANPVRCPDPEAADAMYQGLRWLENVLNVLQQRHKFIFHHLHHYLHCHIHNKRVHQQPSTKCACVESPVGVR